jgi:hypothetical protein
MDVIELEPEPKDPMDVIELEPVESTDRSPSRPPDRKPKRKRKPKPPPEPKFQVGQVVNTRAAVRVRSPGPRNRRYLHILPGAAWQVVAVVPADEGARRQVQYQIRDSQCGHVARRKEFQLRRAA